MRLVIIILGLFLMGGAAALLFALGSGGDRVAVSSDAMVQDLPTPETGDPVTTDDPSSLDSGEVPEDAVEEPPDAATPSPGDSEAALPEPESTPPPDAEPAPDAPDAPDLPAPSDEGPAPSLSVPGLTPDPSPGATAEAPAPAEPPSVAAAPEPRRNPLPAEPVDPAEALAAISPELSTPAAPPVRRPRPAPEPAQSEPTPSQAAPTAPPARSPEPAGSPEAAPAAPGEAETRRIAADRVNLREGPSTDTAALATLSRDDEVEVLETRADWLRVRTASGIEGWVSAQFLAD